MGCRWRIRHKLLLGFGLVIAIIGLLLAGISYGLWSYRETRRAIESKMAELDKADQLRYRIKDLSKPHAQLSDELHVLQKNLHRTRQALEEYEKRLAHSIGQAHNPEYGYLEKQYVGIMNEQFDELKTRLDILEKGGIVANATRYLVQEPEVKEMLDKLDRNADDLKSEIFKNLNDHIGTARDAFWNVLYWVIGTSTAGVLLLMLLFGRFYCWIVHPIRDLLQGVERVAQGDFEHRIEVKSDDEMVGLAARFNHMVNELQALYTDLERQVNDRSRQLVRSERLASVGFLAAGVAHEINNPLASIAFCSEALEGRLQDMWDKFPTGHRHDKLKTYPTLAMNHEAADPDRETIAKYLKMIQDEAFRCKEITQKLLEFSRGGDGTREHVDLNEVIQSVLDVVQHLPDGQDKHLIFRPTETALAWVNAHDIKSVVLNLVINALECMEEGGALTIAHQIKDGHVEIKFKDTGCGMTPDVLDNIFEPFFTRSRTGKGTGLGLSISHRIITQHGGEIEAASPGPNLGSTFIVRLPLQPAEEMPKPAQEVPAAPEKVFEQRRAA